MVPTIGGWTPGRIQLSTFIRDYLADGQESWAQEIHKAYKKAILAEPRHRGGKRRVITYPNFLNYMYLLRKLELIEYLLDYKGEKDTAPARYRVGSEKDKTQTLVEWDKGSPRHFIQANMSRINDPAWQNPRKALYG